MKGDETKTLINKDYYIPGDEIYSDEDIVLVALWEAKPYNYKTGYYLQKLDGAYVLTQTETGKAPFNSTVTANEITFTGFTVNKNVSGTVSSGVITADDNLTLKLYYIRNTYDAKWMSYDGSTILATTSVKYGDVIKAPTTFNADNTRPGYVFNGWNTEQDGSGEMYDIDGYYYPVDVYGKSEVILYAQWEKTTAD